MDESSIPDLDWAVYVDEESGGEYFYNRVTQETQWDAPSEYLDWIIAVTTTYLKSTDSPWRISINESKVFFYNKQTKKSSWKRPPELDEIHHFFVTLTQQRRDAYDAQCANDVYAEDQGASVPGDGEPISPEGTPRQDDDPSLWAADNTAEDGSEYADDGHMEIMFERRDATGKGSASDQMDEPPDESDVTVLIPKLEKKLESADAIMEVDVFETIEKYLKLSGERPETVVTKLKGGYRGYAKMTEVLMEWCRVGPSGGGIGAAAEAEANFSSDGNAVLHDLLAKLIKQKFDKSIADSLIKADSEVPDWLTTMMNDAVWRKLLIELLDSNRGSVLLGYCLRQISAMGHHREIGQTIRDADYFLVFSNLLQDFVIKICSTDDVEIYQRTVDLTRMCGNCDYLFLYTQQFLSLVESKLLESLKSKGLGKKRKLDEIDNSEHIIKEGEAGRFATAMARIARVREEVERSVVWKSATLQPTVEADSCIIDNTLLCKETDKSKLEMKSYFTLRMTSFFASLFLSTDGVYREIADILREGVVEELHVKRLCSHMFGINDRDDDVLIGSDELGQLEKCDTAVLELMAHYQLFAYLLDSLVHPKKKLTSPGCFKRSAALIVAVVLKKDGQGPLVGDEFGTTMGDLTSACSLYEEILSMEFAGGVLLDRCESLLQLIRNHSVISMSILRWLNYSLLDNSFVSSPSYAALCPMLLQFVVTSIELYHLQHPDCFAILQLMHEHKAKFEDSDSGRSIEIVSIKRDIIDCVIYLIGKGYVSGPLNFLSAEVLIADAAIARHIVLCLLECFAPPFEQEFAEKIVTLIVCAGNRKALSSKYFVEKNGPALLKTFCDQISHVTPNLEEALVVELRSTLNGL